MIIVDILNWHTKCSRLIEITSSGSSFRNILLANFRLLNSIMSFSAKVLVLWKSGVVCWLYLLFVIILMQRFWAASSLPSEVDPPQMVLQYDRFDNTSSLYNSSFILNGKQYLLLFISVAAACTLRLNLSM